jgi:hypothetical protein
MEGLTNFLKHSATIFDWLVIFVTILLVVVAVVLLFALRGSKPFLIVIVSALIPLAGGLASTFLKYQEMQRALEMAGDVGAEVVERARAEAWIISYIGIAGAIIIVGTGLIGMVTKKRTAV